MATFNCYQGRGLQKETSGSGSVTMPFAKPAADSFDRIEKRSQPEVSEMLEDSDLSPFRTETSDCSNFGERASASSGAVSGPWTDNEHQSYLTSVEDHFLEKLYQQQYCEADICGMHAKRVRYTSSSGGWPSGADSDVTAVNECEPLSERHVLLPSPPMGQSQFPNAAPAPLLAPPPSGLTALQNLPYLDLPWKYFDSLPSARECGQHRRYDSIESPISQVDQSRASSQWSQLVGSQMLLPRHQDKTHADTGALLNQGTARDTAMYARTHADTGALLDQGTARDTAMYALSDSFREKEGASGGYGIQSGLAETRASGSPANKRVPPGQKVVSRGEVGGFAGQQGSEPWSNQQNYLGSTWVRHWLPQNRYEAGQSGKVDLMANNRVSAGDLEEDERGRCRLGNGEEDARKYTVMEQFTTEQQLEEEEGKRGMCQLQEGEENAEYAVMQDYTRARQLEQDEDESLAVMQLQQAHLGLELMELSNLRRSRRSADKGWPADSVASQRAHQEAPVHDCLPVDHTLNSMPPSTYCTCDSYQSGNLQHHPPHEHHTHEHYQQRFHHCLPDPSHPLVSANFSVQCTHGPSLQAQPTSVAPSAVQPSPVDLVPFPESETDSQILECSRRDGGSSPCQLPDGDLGRQSQTERRDSTMEQVQSADQVVPALLSTPATSHTDSAHLHNTYHDLLVHYNDQSGEPAEYTLSTRTPIPVHASTHGYCPSRVAKPFRVTELSRQTTVFHLDGTNNPVAPPVIPSTCSVSWPAVANFVPKGRLPASQTASQADPGSSGPVQVYLSQALFALQKAKKREGRRGEKARSWTWGATGFRKPVVPREQKKGPIGDSSQ